MLSSMSFRGSCRLLIKGGKLYFGVVVIGNCAFTKIHQHLCLGRSWYLNIVHEQFAQYNNNNARNRRGYMAESKSIHLKMKVGEVEFEIDCSVEELRDVVDRVLAAVAESDISGSVAATSVDTGGPAGLGGRGETCKSVILALWREGWFGIGRSLGEVHGEMGRRGFHYDRTAVAHALVDLVREGVLTRVGRPRRYRYLQKRPSPTQAEMKAE